MPPPAYKRGRDPAGCQTHTQRWGEMGEHENGTSEGYLFFLDGKGGSGGDGGEEGGFGKKRSREEEVELEEREERTHLG